MQAMDVEALRAIMLMCFMKGPHRPKAYHSFSGRELIIWIVLKLHRSAFLSLASIRGLNSIKKSAPNGTDFQNTGLWP